MINFSWEEVLTAIAVGGVFLLLVGDRVFQFFKQRGIDPQIIQQQIADMHDQIEINSRAAAQTADLHDWHDHDVNDQPGVKVWWNQQYLADCLKDVAKLLSTQTHMLELMQRDSATQHEALQANVMRSENIANETVKMLAKIVDKLETS